MNRLKKSILSLLVAIIVLISIIAIVGAKTTNSIGDINADGTVSAADARLALRASVGLEKLTDTQFKSADVNNDSKVTAADARTILRVSVGLDKFDIKGENTDNSSDNWNFEIDNNNVVKTNEFGGGYINNRVIIEFSNTNEEFIKDIVVSIDGKIIGFSETGTYQIEIQERTLDELKQLCKQLKGKEDIVSAHYDIIGTTSRRLNEITIPNDPWKDTFQGISGTDWDEYNPNGLNWWLETIEAPSAWQNNNRFKNIITGIVDDGFDYQHEDLGITVLNNSQNSFEDHGTHVAGIIGATANNNIGITGIVWNKDLYCYDAFLDKKISLENACKGIESLLLSGCKTINLSSEWYVEDNEINAYGAWAIEKIIKWKENPDIGDFIIVQSAGNHAYDSLKAGLFASITEEAMKLYCDENETKYSYDDIIQHIIIVGAIEKKSSGYQMTDFSNYGSNVSICAPGKDIFSTVVMGGIDGNYAHNLWDGTSMAAPMVTGVASLVWSVNPDFGAGEVKDIVCHSYNKTADPYHYPTDVRVYPIVNAKLAVEEAIRRTDKKGAAKGTFVDSKTGIVVNNVKMECLKYTGDINNYSLADFNINATDGTFSCELYEGVYEYKIIADGYAQERNIILDIKTGKCDEKGKINLIPIIKTSIITGTITVSKTRSPISNVCVEAIDNESGSLEPVKTAITDTNGKYSLELPYGSYSLSFNHENYEYYGTSLSVSYEAYEENATLHPKGNSDNTEERTVIDSGNCGAYGDNVTWTLYEDGELVISGSGEMKDYFAGSYSSSYSAYTTAPWFDCDFNIITVNEGVTYIGNYAFAILENLTSISISKTIKNIGAYAFAKSINLENVILQENSELNCISSSAFEYCNKLTNINLNNCNQLDIIQSYAFYNCSSITNIVIPNSVTEIGGYAFGGCSKLTNLIIPKNVTKIGNNAFRECTSLTYIEYNAVNVLDCGDDIFTNAGKNSTELTVIITDNVINIPAELFKGYSYNNGGYVECYNANITSVIIGNNVSNIGYSAFAYCKNLKEVNIPSSVTKIEAIAFYHCSNLKNINVDKDNINYSSVNGILYSKDKTELIHFPAKNTNSFVIPNGVKIISDYAFSYCESLESIKIPNSVTSIGKDAFSNCINLTSVELPNSIETISYEAFKGCRNVVAIRIPKSVMSIDYAAFYNCVSLTDIYYTGTQEEWNNITIGSDNEYLTNATIHYNS